MLTKNNNKRVLNFDPCGILIVDKEKGLTSHDVVKRVRSHFKLKKVGHAGTLDPNATGVLVLLIGKATKQSANFLNKEKEYFATVKLGERTDSCDCDGQIIEKKDVTVTEEEVKQVILSFIGESEQIPPMVSAKKIAGKRLYSLARKGIEVERKSRTIVISDIEISEISLPIVKFRCACSKGTYIRQLADDIGKELGCGAHLTDLKRLRSGAFTIEQAIFLTELLKMERKDFYESLLRV